MSAPMFTFFWNGVRLEYAVALPVMTVVADIY